MPVIEVKLKHGRDVYPVALDTDEDPSLFKRRVFELTGIRPMRQKIFIKGKLVKDDGWNEIIVAPNSTLLLMGTKEEDVQLPVEERQDEEVVQTESLRLPAGLANLGNTCYMNATIQCLRTIPVLRTALDQYASQTDSSDIIIQSLRELYSLMDKAATVPPITFLKSFHSNFPRFAEKTAKGIFQQQDANEFWVELVILLQKLPAVHYDGMKTVGNNFVEQYLSGSYDITLKCNESDEEPVSESRENFTQLSCFIAQDTKTISQGLKSRLMETITKKSTVLDKDALFLKTSKISRLPAYLTVQFVRFFYNKNKAVNAKILKEIKFSLMLDVYELCTESLQKKLMRMRDKFKEEEDRIANRENCDEPKTGTVDRDIAEYSFKNDLGSNSSGYYSLQAVLTHQGRSSSSGHYVAWIKHAKNLWMKCDDWEVTPVTDEAIFKLCGGGDWHSAYVLLYGPRLFESSLG